MLESDESNLLSLSCPPTGDTAPPIKKKKKSKTSTVALPQPTAPDQVESTSRTTYLDRAKLRRNYYGSSTLPSTASRAITDPVQNDQIQVARMEDSGVHAKSLSMITPRAGLGSERLVDEQERARFADLDWRERGKEKARLRLREMD